jgi:hypothetical protein
MNTSNDLDSLYQEYWRHHDGILGRGHDPLEIAAVLVTQALSIYRTVLTAEDYNRMVDDIGARRDQVRKLVPGVRDIH